MKNVTKKCVIHITILVLILGLIECQFVDEILTNPHLGSKRPYIPLEKSQVQLPFASEAVPRASDGEILWLAVVSR